MDIGIKTAVAGGVTSAARIIRFLNIDPYISQVQKSKSGKPKWPSAVGPVSDRIDLVNYIYISGPGVSPSHLLMLCIDRSSLYIRRGWHC